MINIKKNIFLVFTPYHIKVSNFIAKEFFGNEENRIIVSSFTGIPRDSLEKHIDKNYFGDSKYFRLLYPLKKVISKNKEIRMEINKFITYCKDFNPDEIVIFSDQPAIYQEVINKLKKINDKIIVSMVEEGLALYVTSENEREVKNTKRFNYIYCKLLGIKDYKYVQHGKAEFINKIYAREPDLIDSDVIKIKIDSCMLKEIVNLSDINIKEVKSDKYSILVPSSVWYDNTIRLKIFERIFKRYKNDNRVLVVNLHPAEEHFDDILDLANKFKDNVLLLPKGKYISEDLLGDGRICEIISDYSSTLINGIYLRDDIVAITYSNVLKNEYKVNHFPNISIFEYLLEKNKIKEIDLE